MNQNLSKLGGQLRDIWNQLGAPQRLTVISATLVLLLSMGGLAFWSSRTDYGLLYGRLSDGEAAKVIAALDDAKVPYKVGAGGSSISVPTEKVHLMRMQLAGRGIPRGDGVGFEIFDKANFGISDFVQRANYVRAVQGELARTISQLDEVESARVMIVLPENRLLLDKDKYATASVFIRVRGNNQLPAQSVNSIRFLVANAVEGLKPNHVSLVDNLGNVLSENSDNDSLTGLSSSQLGARRNLEQYLGKKAQDMLEKVLGPGQAIVRISAEINHDTVSRTEEKYDPDGSVLRSETKNDEDMDLTTASVSTPAGISANTVIQTNTTASTTPVNNTKNRKAITTVQYELSKSTSNLMQTAGDIKRLSASVTVAARFEGTGAARKMAPRSPEELEKLRRLVSGALGIQTGEENTRGDIMTLEELPFNDQFATDVTRELEKQQKHDFWWEMARSAAYPAMGLVALFVLWRLFKRTPIQDIPIGVSVGRLMAQNGNGRYSNGHSNGNGHGNGDSTGVVTVDVLNRLIKENPVNMTQAIREWLDKGRSPHA